MQTKTVWCRPCLVIFFLQSNCYLIFPLVSVTIAERYVRPFERDLVSIRWKLAHPSNRFFFSSLPYSRSDDVVETSDAAFSISSARR